MAAAAAVYSFSTTTTTTTTTTFKATTKPPAPPPLNLTTPKPLVHKFHKFPTPRLTSTYRATPSSSTAAVASEDEVASMSIDALRRFIDLNLGNWTGSFHQFDADGNSLHKIETKLAASSYGEDDLISLIQTLYIKQASSSTSVPGDDVEPEWAEYKIKETNMFTVDKYQQIGFFPLEKAFVLRYQTAGMLETVLRQGVLGEDDIGEESPKNLKLPSRMPSIVCESCLYSLENDARARAFHIMDPKGIIEMLVVFHEERGGGVLMPAFLDDCEDNTSRITPHLGHWSGFSITKRSGLYGATISEAETMTKIEIDESGQIIQDQTSTSKDNGVTTNVRWTGTRFDNLVKYDGGFQVTLLPGGMYMGCPSDVGKSVEDSKSFHLEFCWLESPGKRQRLVRTYDVEGMAVSSTYFLESKL